MKSSARKAGNDEDELKDVDAKLRTGHPTTKFEGATIVYPAFDFGKLPLKPDHPSRPVWVCPDGHIFLEQYSPRYEQARDFLVQIAEPCSRPVFIHEYQLDKNALFAAASMGLTSKRIVEALEALSKVPLSEQVQRFIHNCTVGYGKVKIVLSRGRYFLESYFPAILRKLNQLPIMKQARVKTLAEEEFELGEDVEETEESLGLQGILETSTSAGLRRLVTRGVSGKSGRTLTYAGDGVLSRRRTGEVDSDDDSEEDGADEVVASMAKHGADELDAGKSGRTGAGASSGAGGSGGAKSRGSSKSAASGLFTELEDAGERADKPVRFQIHNNMVDAVKQACLKMDPPFPLMREYDFKADSLPELDIHLRQPEILREYQARSLAKMFGNGRARSGIIVLPCGAGKTLVGISAAATIRKSCLVICPHNTSVEQWIDSFIRFTTLSRTDPTAGAGAPSRNRQIVRLISGSQDQMPPRDEACIVFTTYSMVTMTESRGRAPTAENAAKLAALRSRTWGLMVLDETHQLVAKTYKQVLAFAPAHCHLGLTATLVREDGQDKHLSRLIGPKLYEANWRDLTLGGFLARVKVAEVWCPMTSEFYAEYLTASHRKQLIMAVLNPNKCHALEWLMKKHKNDKIIVFSESVVALLLYARKFDAPFVCGSTARDDRESAIRAFRREGSSINTLFLSKVGDVALDVPDANVLIQISSHGGSRLQEAQRMGRILRKSSRSRSSDTFDSYFYTLLSMDTTEMLYSEKRRRYLVAQGYEYHVIRAWPDLAPTEDVLRGASTFMKSDEDRKDVLRLALSADAGSERKEDQALRMYEGSFDDEDEPGYRPGGARAAARRTTNTMDALTGATGVRYLEVAVGSGKGASSTAAASSGKPAWSRAKLKRRPKPELPDANSLGIGSSKVQKPAKVPRVAKVKPVE